MNKEYSSVVILDYGSQYTKLIARRVRELGYLSWVLPGDCNLAAIQEKSPRALILSGGPQSVYDSGAPALPDGLLDYQIEHRIPLLGICYGMQLLAQAAGAKVSRGDVREYGRMAVECQSSAVWWPKGASKISVWMSHGDEIESAPDGYQVSALSESGILAAMENAELRRVGLQFHPEVTHSERGLDLLSGFLEQLGGLKPDWNMSSFEKEVIEKIRADVPPQAHVICALSGGVDSTVAATLVHRAIGDRLHCIFVNHGLLRLNEEQDVAKLFTEQLHLPVEIVDASERFLAVLDGVTDPEVKRKAIGREFIEVFRDYSHSLEKKLGERPQFLVQGTLYPDVIESSPPPGSTTNGSKHSAKIKSHHNVGGLPKDLPFTLIEPLRDLFKDEVRKLGLELGVPRSFLERHPFPGPGLAVRILGAITPERLKILREVDHVWIREIKNAGLYNEIWQAFAVFLPIQTVGVQGDGRTHDYVVGLRAVTSSDGMTADWYPFESSFLGKVSNTICNEVRGVNRVVYDVTSKPPATIEWE